MEYQQTIIRQDMSIKKTAEMPNGAEKIVYSKELSEVEKMAVFKKEFYADLEKLGVDRTIANVAINISEQAFQNMKDDPEYREKVMSVIKRDLSASVAPAPDCSLLITVGATLKDYRADAWPVNNDSEFFARSQDSFYKKTNGSKKEKQKELLEEYLEKRAQIKSSSKKSALFLVGTWVFFDMGEWAFLLYAVI